MEITDRFGRSRQETPEPAQAAPQEDPAQQTLRDRLIARGIHVEGQPPEDAIERPDLVEAGARLDFTKGKLRLRGDTVVGSTAHLSNCDVRDSEIHGVVEGGLVMRSTVAEGATKRGDFDLYKTDLLWNAKAEGTRDVSNSVFHPHASVSEDVDVNNCLLGEGVEISGIGTLKDSAFAPGSGRQGAGSVINTLVPSGEVLSGTRVYNRGDGLEGLSARETSFEDLVDAARPTRPVSTASVTVNGETRSIASEDGATIVNQGVAVTTKGGQTEVTHGEVPWEPDEDWLKGLQHLPETIVQSGGGTTQFAVGTGIVQTGDPDSHVQVVGDPQRFAKRRRRIQEQ